MNDKHQWSCMKSRYGFQGLASRPAKPGDQFWDPPKKHPIFFGSWDSEFPKAIDLLILSWSRRLHCSDIQGGKKKSIFITAEKTEEVEKHAHVFCSPSKMNSADTGTGHVYAIHGGKRSKSGALKHQFFPPFLKQNLLDEQLCINPPLNPGSPRRALRPPPSSSSIMTVTARASRQGQFLPAETKKQVRVRAALSEIHIV